MLDVRLRRAAPALFLSLGALVPGLLSTGCATISTYKAETRVPLEETVETRLLPQEDMVYTTIHDGNLRVQVDRVTPCEKTMTAHAEVTETQVRTPHNLGMAWGSAAVFTASGIILLAVAPTLGDAKKPGKQPEQTGAYAAGGTSLAIGAIGAGFATVRSFQSIDKVLGTRTESTDIERKTVECKRLRAADVPVEVTYNGRTIHLGSTDLQGRLAVSGQDLVAGFAPDVCLGGVRKIEVRAAGQSAVLDVGTFVDDYWNRQWEEAREGTSLEKALRIPSRCPKSPHASEALALAFHLTLSRFGTMTTADLLDVFSRFPFSVLKSKGLAGELEGKLSRFSAKLRDLPALGVIYAGVEPHAPGAAARLHAEARRLQKRELEALGKLQSFINQMAKAIEKASGGGIRAQYSFCDVAGDKVVVDTRYGGNSFGILASYAFGGAFNAAATEADLFENGRDQVARIGALPLTLMQQAGQSYVRKLKGFLKRRGGHCRLPWYATRSDLGSVSGSVSYMNPTKDQAKALEEKAAKLEWAASLAGEVPSSPVPSLLEPGAVDWPRWTPQAASAVEFWERTYSFEEGAHKSAGVSLVSIVRSPRATKLKFRLLRPWTARLCWHREGPFAPYLQADDRRYPLTGGDNVEWCGEGRRYEKGEEFELWFPPLDAEVRRVHLINGRQALAVRGQLSFPEIELETADSP